MIERKAVSRDQEVASGLQFPHSRGTVKVIIDGFSKCDQFFNIQAKRLQGRNKKKHKTQPCLRSVNVLFIYLSFKHVYIS